MSDQMVDEGRAVEFESLLGPILDRAYAFAYSLCHNHSDAENLVQEAALKAFAAFASYRANSNFRAWYLRILTNCHYELHRKSKHVREVAANDANLDLFLLGDLQPNSSQWW
jgi:RNA polymerase sigma-70 factor (ECF subfamily)